LGNKVSNTPSTSTNMEPHGNGAGQVVPPLAAAEAYVEVGCQMGSSCIYQKVLSRTLVSRSDSTTVINARIRSCFKDFGPYNEKTGRYPVPSHYSCKLSDDLNTNYVVASCNINAPFVGGYDSKDGKWHLRKLLNQELNMLFLT